MTDLGQRTLESILFGDDPAAGRDVLVATGEALARLHRTPFDPGRFAGIDTWTLASREWDWAAVGNSLRDLRLPAVPAAGDQEQRRLAPSEHFDDGRRYLAGDAAGP